MLLKTLLFPLMMGTCLNSAFGMGSPEKIQDNQEKILQSREITSPEYMKKYRQILLKMANEENYDGVLTLSYPKPPIIYKPIIISDNESYLFDRAKALYQTYNGLAQKSELNPKLCIQYYDKALEEINTYLTKFKDFTSKIQSVNDRMVWHQFYLYGYAGKAYSQIAHYPSVLEVNILEPTQG